MSAPPIRACRAASSRPATGAPAPCHLRTALRLGVDFISYCIDDLPTPMPFLARRVFGLPLICWTVRTPAQLRKAQRWTDQITFEGFAA